ncbi:alpha-ketoglutarate-dependent dioxygenase alkB homolog 7, mitochondrial isoform X3 [Mobula hypostoma]|uniref:alpha-ketoglutarate-dependent dioxygenase alkB homolog 7, mitochondrial isoform X3 n=1 Tax=Mobula hypostoma TaxID=723540 RepID=UPI002FC297B5
MGSRGRACASLQCRRPADGGDLSPVRSRPIAPSMGLSARVLGRCKALTPRQPLRYPRRPHGAPGLQLMLASSPALLRRLSRDIELRPDFLSPAEEAALLRELEREPRLKRQRYQRDHWDQFCGDTIAGMCLLSSSVMRLVSEDSSEDWVDLLLQRRSAYVLRGAARYQFSHQILRDEESFFGSQKVPRDRRISIICRNLPISSESADHPSYTHDAVLGPCSLEIRFPWLVDKQWER